MSHRAAIAHAPPSRSSVSIPASAAGRSPTGESTENLPPTFPGTGSERRPRSSARPLRKPRRASVVTTTWSRTAPGPTVSSSLPQTVRNRARVSAVEPDLLTTLKSVRARSRRPSSATVESGSGLSRTCSRGRWPRAAPSSSFQPGGRRASRRAAAPSAEPPIPMTTRSSKRRWSRAAATSRVCAARVRSAGRSRESEIAGCAPRPHRLECVAEAPGQVALCGRAPSRCRQRRPCARPHAGGIVRARAAIEPRRVDPSPLHCSSDHVVEVNRDGARPGGHGRAQSISTASPS